MIMSEPLTRGPSRRDVRATSVITLLAASAVALAMALLATQGTPAAAEDASIHPFQVSIPEEALTDLRQRLAASRWPDKETVADQSQGAQLANLQELVGYWSTEYDWRRAEAKLNAFPQFRTEIDGLDFHFIHVTASRRPR
jgi:hypothetical protein